MEVSDKALNKPGKFLIVKQKQMVEVTSTIDQGSYGLTFHSIHFQLWSYR